MSEEGGAFFAGMLVVGLAAIFGWFVFVAYPESDRLRECAEKADVFKCEITVTVAPAKPVPAEGS